MVAISQTAFQVHLVIEKFNVLIRMKFVPQGLIDNKSTLVQVITWRRTGAKLLHEPMMTELYGAYLRHKGMMS